AEETYTDNVRLSPRGAERSDWVTTLRPAFTLSTSGPRLRADLRYAPQLIYRKNEDTHDVFNYLQGYASAEVLNELLFLDAQAYSSRQNASLLGPQAESDVNRTSNRTSVHAYSISPFLRRTFARDITAEVRYSHNVVKYGASNLSSSEADRVDAVLTSGSPYNLTSGSAQGLTSGAAYSPTGIPAYNVGSGLAYKAFTWNVAYFKDHIRYTETHQSVDMERINAGAHRRITANVGILASVGYERNDYLTVGPPPSGKFWSVGPEWTPTPRTHLAATIGRRFFGPTRTLDFSHRTRLTTWTLTYDEDLTTGRGQVLVPVSFDTASYLDTLLLPRIPEPGPRQTAVQSLIAQTGLPAQLSAPVNYVTTVPFVQKRLRAAFGINGVRNTVLIHAFRQTRDTNAGSVAIGAGSGDLALSPRIVQTGGGVLWSLRISPATTSNASIDVARNEFPSIDREDTLTTFRIALVKQFQPRVSGTVEFRHLQNHSNQGAASYRENAVMAGIRLSF
ncbi:MAG: TIGR03016 family PEP-CTERM system-associated outer membrane protein, partial [Rhodospirillaceae bacterium]